MVTKLASAKVHADPNEFESHQHQKVKSAIKEFGTELKNKSQIVSVYKKVCAAYDPKFDILQPKLQLKSVVLVILLNNPLYHILPLVELTYRPLFPHIVYCMSNGNSSKESKDWNLKIVYYKSPPGEPGGLLNYICVEYVYKLGLKADGFLFIGDDVLVSPSAVAKISKQPLPASTVCHYKSYTCYPNMTNPPWYCKMDPAVSHLYQSTEALASMRRELKQLPQDSVGPRCDRIIQRLSGVKDPLVHCSPDIFYIPSPLMEDASVLSRQFYNHKVFHAVAPYHIVTCLSSPAPVYPITFHDVHGLKRLDFTQTVPHVVSGKKLDMVHPFKLSPLFNRTAKYDKYFCKMVLPFLHNAK